MEYWVIQSLQGWTLILLIINTVLVYNYLASIQTKEYTYIISTNLSYFYNKNVKVSVKGAGAEQIRRIAAETLLSRAN